MLNEYEMNLIHQDKVRGCEEDLGVCIVKDPQSVLSLQTRP